MGRSKKYHTDEEKIAAHKLQMQKWRKDNPNKYAEKKKIYYENNKDKYIENAVKWNKCNPEKAKKMHQACMKRYDAKRTILKQIEKIGEDEWMKTATAEQMEIYTEYKLKMDKQNQTDV